MAESRDISKQIDHFIARSQKEIVDASRSLGKSISKQTDRVVTPVTGDIEYLLDDVFDFTERVINSQRRMVNDAIRAVNR